MQHDSIHVPSPNGLITYSIYQLLCAPFPFSFPFTIFRLIKFSIIFFTVIRSRKDHKNKPITFNPHSEMDPSMLPPPPTEATIAQATNATSSLGPKPNHPPYAEMITTAIAALKEKTGSSKRAIAKYIAREYTDLPLSHPALLTQHLKRLKKTGQLVMVKNSYKLPGSAPANGNTTSSDSKRGPGRPPKPKVEPSFLSVGLQDGPDMGKKRPGRPPKAKTGLAETVLVVEGSDGPIEPIPESGLIIPDGQKRARKRPTKLGSISAVMGSVGPKRSPGRPPKTTNISSATNVPKKRGWPRGRPRTSVVGNAVSDNGGGGLQGNRLRQLTMVGGTATSRKSTGRPVGRPKKTLSGTRVAQPQWISSGDVKRDFENLQSRIKQVVSILKPQLAILEELATIRINA